MQTRRNREERAALGREFNGPPRFSTEHAQRGGLVKLVGRTVPVGKDDSQLEFFSCRRNRDRVAAGHGDTIQTPPRQRGFVSEPGAPPEQERENGEREENSDSSYGNCTTLTAVPSGCHFCRSFAGSA